MREYTLEEIIRDTRNMIADNNHIDLCMCDAWPDNCKYFPYGRNTPFSTNVEEVLEIAFPLLRGEAGW